MIRSRKKKSRKNPKKVEKIDLFEGQKDIVL